MGKQGPCHHCGVTNTPLWRNGPPEKPVLCNACGSRWRIKGTLVNYIPLHSRAEGDYEDPRAKMLSLKRSDRKLKKRKLSYENNSLGRYASDFSPGFQKSIDEVASNSSRSGSAVSNSERCAQFSEDASDLTGPSQSVAWEAQVPSKKRTSMSRPKSSSVEKLTRDLCAILHEQQSAYLSGTCKEELLLESNTPMVSVEIGHGSVLIKHPSLLSREEESEASSLSVENKLCVLNETYSYSKNFSSQEEPIEREKSIHDKMQLLWNHNSPLCHIDLNDSKFTDDNGEHVDALGGSCKKSNEEVIQKTAGTRASFKSPKRIFLRPGPTFKSLPETRNLMLDPPDPFSDENTDQDLLFNVPSNGVFPQAELLPISSFVSHQTGVKCSSMNPAMLYP